MCPLHNESVNGNTVLTDDFVAEMPADEGSYAGENAPGRSLPFCRFTFSASADFISHGLLHRTLRNLRIILPLLAAASLFLFFSDLPHKYIWLIFIVCAAGGLFSQLFLMVLRAPRRRELPSVTLSFYPEIFELDLPAALADEIAPDYNFAEQGDGPADEEAELFFKGSRLFVRLPLDNLLDQAYLTEKRATLITFDIDFAGRLLKLIIPDAALDRESRSELETEVFNRAGRSLRAVRE